MKHDHFSEVHAYLTDLGLTNEEISVFIYLNKHGKSSVLGISRGLETGRTKLYTLLDRLIEKRLVVANKRHYGTNYEAASLRSLEFLVTEIESQTEKLKRSLPSITTALGEMRHGTPLGSQILEYHGVDGVNQMNFHLNQADGLIQVLELAQLDEHPGLDPEFAEKLREQRTAKQIICHDLTNNKNWTINSKVAAYPKFNRTRYIDPEVFTIEFETYVYNDCVALLNYDEHDVFGIEIHNKALARQQKQIFKLLWQMGTEIDLN